MRKRSTGLIALAAAAAFAPLATAGTYVESVATNHFSPQAQAQTMKMWTGNGRIRMEMQKGQQVQIFKDKTFYTLNVANKSYTRLDKAALDALTQQASETTKSIEALVPPEQRDKMKQQSKPKIDRSVKPTNRTESAIGQKCKVWEVLSNGTKVQELCVVEVSALPNGKELVATMEQVGEAFKGTAASAGVMEVWQDVKTMNGYPVITRMYLNGKLFQEVKTTAIRSEATPDSLFVVPAGFQEQKMGGIG
jgi:hypothetical protein